LLAAGSGGDGSAVDLLAIAVSGEGIRSLGKAGPTEDVAAALAAGTHATILGNGKRGKAREASGSNGSSGSSGTIVVGILVVVVGILVVVVGILGVLAIRIIAGASGVLVVGIIIVGPSGVLVVGIIVVGI